MAQMDSKGKDLLPRQFTASKQTGRRTDGQVVSRLLRQIGVSQRDISSMLGDM